MAAVVFVVLLLSFSAVINAQYTPTWDSLDKRPLPSWYDEAKLGIFIHWGVFSVPSFSSEWFWHDWKKGIPAITDFMRENYRPDFTYPDFAKYFTSEFFEADEWANIFNSSGARYIVFVSKHHEGYTNWPSKYSFNWNSMDVGPNRDLVGELEQAIRSRTSIKFGLYHSQFEWFNPLYLQDQANNFSTQDFVNDKSVPELYEIVNRYKPDVVWSDGSGGGSSDYWKAKEFLAWLYNKSPVRNTVVVNDRWGTDTACLHGDFYTCKDRYDPGHLVTHKWENAMTIDRYSWGYRRNARLVDYLSIEELLTTFIRTVSCGGNMLMNVGPRHDGFIDPLMQERLKQVGDWLAVNGEAIYATRPWTFQNDTANPDVWYTKKTVNGQTNVFAILSKWPTINTVKLGAPKPSESTKVSMLGYGGNLSWSSPSKGKLPGINIELPPMLSGRQPCQWAWVFKLTALQKK